MKACMNCTAHSVHRGNGDCFMRRPSTRFGCFSAITYSWERLHFIVSSSRLQGKLPCSTLRRRAHPLRGREGSCYDTAWTRGVTRSCNEPRLRIRCDFKHSSIPGLTARDMEENAELAAAYAAMSRSVRSGSEMTKELQRRADECYRAVCKSFVPRAVQLPQWSDHRSYSYRPNFMEEMRAYRRPKTPAYRPGTAGADLGHKHGGQEIADEQRTRPRFTRVSTGRWSGGERQLQNMPRPVEVKVEAY
jgi:hypothetical protein